MIWRNCIILCLKVCYPTRWRAERRVDGILGVPMNIHWANLAEGIGQILHKRGLVDSPTISQFEKQYVEKYFFGGYLPEKLWEGDSRCIAIRSKEIGWQPRHPTIYETLEQEINYLLQNNLELTLNWGIIFRNWFFTKQVFISEVAVKLNKS